MDSKDGNISASDDSFGNAAEECSFDAGSSVSTHYDEVDIVIGGILQDVISWLPSFDGSNSVDVTVLSLVSDGSGYFFTFFFKLGKQVVDAGGAAAESCH